MADRRMPRSVGRKASGHAVPAWRRIPPSTVRYPGAPPGPPKLGRFGPGVDHDVPVVDVRPGPRRRGAGRRAWRKPPDRSRRTRTSAAGWGRGGSPRRVGRARARRRRTPAAPPPSARGDGELLPDDGAHGELEAWPRRETTSRIAPHTGRRRAGRDARPPKWRRDRHRGRAAAGSVRRRSAGRRSDRTSSPSTYAGPSVLSVSGAHRVTMPWPWGRRRLRL